VTRTSKTQRGLTLLEVVVALSLSALILVAIQGVLGSLLRQKKRTSVDVHHTWAYELDRLFWNDLAQANAVALNQEGLLLRLPSHVISRTRHNHPNLAPTCNVVYRLNPNSDGLNRLVRELYDGTATQGNPLVTQTLLWDVRELRFERIDDAGVNQPLPKDFGPTPRAFRYELWLGQDSNPRSHEILVR
jgi:prepilin-type N-terminal cleavage/methylation domain-containing protein